MTRGAVEGTAPWTDAEKLALRRAYVDGGICAAREALPHRSLSALYHRAERLGLKRRRRWTTVDDHRLRRLWDGELSIRDIAQRLGRTEITTYWRAQKLGLPLGCPRGWEYLTHAAERTGYGTGQLRAILRAADVRIRRAITRPGAKRRGTGKRKAVTWVVWPPDVDVAVALWLEREPLECAARRVGVRGETLAKWLADAGIHPPAGRRRKERWRVHPDEVARAIASRRASA